MSARLSILVLVVAVALTTAASADTIVVDWDGSEDFMIIQDGIDYASEGDTVLVMPGIYEGPGNTYIGFGGTNLVLKSFGGARSTVIDGQRLTHGFFFCGSESAASVVEGFSIINGSAVEGAGMRLVGASPTIRNCVFNRNVSTGQGGASTAKRARAPRLSDAHSPTTPRRGAAELSTWNSLLHHSRTAPSTATACRRPSTMVAQCTAEP